MRFEFLDSFIALAQFGFHVLGLEAPRNVLRAIGVPGAHAKHDRLFDPGTVVVWPQALQDLRIGVHHTRLSPDLHASPLGVVDEEQLRARILCQVAESDVLPVAAEVGEGQRVFIEQVQESGRAAAMLNIRLPFEVRGREKEATLRGDEPAKIRRDGSFPATALFHARIGAARSAARLDGLHRFGEGHIARVAGSHSLSRPQATWRAAATGKSITVCATLLR